MVGFPPKSSHFNRDFHYFHHPFWGTTIFGNTYIPSWELTYPPSKSALFRMIFRTYLLPFGGKLLIVPWRVTQIWRFKVNDVFFKKKRKSGSSHFFSPGCMSMCFPGEAADVDLVVRRKVFLSRFGGESKCLKHPLLGIEQVRMHGWMNHLMYISNNFVYFSSQCLPGPGSSCHFVAPPCFFQDLRSLVPDSCF